MSTPKSEERRPNPFYPAFDLLLAKLLAVDQALNVSEAALRPATESSDEWQKRIPQEPIRYMLADICDDREPGYVKLIPSVRVPDKETELLLRTARDFMTQSYLWGITRSSEAFREFAESIVKKLPADDEEATAQDPGPVKKKEENRRMRFDSALKRIRDAAPTLVACERANARSIPLQQWIRVAAQVRHAVAHNEGILEQESYEKSRLSGLEKYFPGDLEDDTGYVLKPTPETTVKAIQTFREYGVAIYKAVSDALGFPATILGLNGEITTWRR